MKTYDTNGLANGIARRDGFSFSRGLQEAHDLVKEGKVHLKNAAHRKLKKHHKKHK